MCLIIVGIYKMHVNEINITSLQPLFWQVSQKKKLIDEGNYKGLTIYFTRSIKVDKKSIKALCLHYYELMGKSEEHERKNLWWSMNIC